MEHSTKKFLSVTLAVVLAVFAVVSAVSAGTTISSNISTDGTLNAGGNFTVGGYATTTASSGNISTAGNIEAIGTASSTSLIVGGNSTTVSGIAFGYCNISNSSTITASSSKTFICSDATGVNTSTRVFLQATSSLPSGLSIQTASSTAAGTIQLTIWNALPTGVATAPGSISINFFGIR